MISELENTMVKAPKKPNLVVMIPAYNEGETISRVIREIPRKIEGINSIKVLVVDDGSKDDTIIKAKKAGADYVLRNKQNLGLAKSFKKGMEVALSLKADIIVNTDGDFQYNQQEIPKLIKPLLNKEADIVSGNRQVERLDHMVKAKKYGNMMGSKFVSRFMNNQKIKDASSGFRAFTKDAALKLFVMSNHTYTHETLIQASNLGLRVVEVPVEFRMRNGKSKLIKSIFGHIKKSVSTIVRTTLMYNPLKALSSIGVLLILAGSYPLVRWFILNYVIHTPGDHIQSLLLGLLLIIFGGLSILLGFVADLIATNRRYLEEVLYRLKKNEYLG